MSAMRDRFWLLVAGAALTTIPATAQQSCESLTRLALLGITISSAIPVPAGKFTPPNQDTFVDVSAFCRVAGSAWPEVKFEIWMPTQWNRKLLAVGNGGLAGSINFRQMVEPLERGYATGSTDTGHQGSGNDGSWALGHMERVIDFAHRAVHVTAQADKALV